MEIQFKFSSHRLGCHLDVVSNSCNIIDRRCLREIKIWFKDDVGTFSSSRFSTAEHFLFVGEKWKRKKFLLIETREKEQEAIVFTYIAPWVACVRAKATVAAHGNRIVSSNDSLEFEGISNLLYSPETVAWQLITKLSKSYSSLSALHRSDEI